MTNTNELDQHIDFPAGTSLPFHGLEGDELALLMEEYRTLSDIVDFELSYNEQGCNWEALLTLLTIEVCIISEPDLRRTSLARLRSLIDAMADDLAVQVEEFDVAFGDAA